jgi:DNA-binding CsgD family transcriptional regulator
MKIVDQHSLERNGSVSTIRFSKREIEVLELASQGMTNPQIARRLGLSVHAIKFHLGSIYRKTGVSNRTEAAVAYALRMSNGANEVDAAGPQIAS